MNKYSNWIVAGPLRSGTLAVTRSVVLTLPNWVNYQGPDSIPQPLNCPEIIQTHDTNWLNFADDNTGVVICIRNPIECALSWCILPKFGVADDGKLNYHFFNKDIKKVEELNNNIVPFYLEVGRFQQSFNFINSFYENLKIKSNYYVLAYEDWHNDPSLIATRLGINICRPEFPIKSPGTPEEWIKNWDEIQQFSKTLLIKEYSQICQRKHWQRRY